MCSDLTSVYISDLEAWCKIVFSGYYSNPLNYAHHLFLDGVEIKDVIIPNSVTSIGEYTFSGCSGLISVTIPNGVTTIGNSAFSECGSLVSIIIPSSVTSIEDFAFAHCSGLTSIAIPNNVTSIGESAFSGCSGLTSVTIPNSVISIGNSAFSKCNGLISVTISNIVMSIGRSLFSGCSGLTSVTIPNSVTSIGDSAFKGCSGLTSITIPNSVMSIGDNAFSDCSRLTSINISNNVTSIPNNAFTNCRGLTSVTIPNSVTSIGWGVFSGCSSLTFVTIPQSVTNISGKIISGCSNLKYICLLSDKYPCSTSLGNISCQYIMPQIAFDGGIPKDITNYATYGVTPMYIKVKSTTATTATLELTAIDIKSGKTNGTTIYEAKVYDLKPETYVSGSWEIKDKDRGMVSIPTLYTKNLVMEVQAAQALSTTKARLSATVNEANDDMRYGFEWLRYDAPDNMTPHHVSAPLYNGQIVGTLSNLNPEIYYKYRPFYKADDSTIFLGEWEAFITGDANVFFEPEVHTNEPIALSRDGAQLSGVWVEGTENIQEKGFEYWRKSSYARPVGTTRGGNVIAVIGSNTSITLEGLEAGTEYVYRSYVKTASCTTYGEEVTFKTPLLGDANNDGVVNVVDIVEIVNAKAGNPSASFNMTNADVNDDGFVNVADYVKLSKIIMKQE